MKRIPIILFILLLALVSPGRLSTHAAEIAPDKGVITYTFNPDKIELTDVNAGSGGMLYITDKANGVAVVLDPLIPEYKVFSLAISGDTGDVQPAPDGRVWYTDNVELLGVLDPAACDTYMESCSGKVWQFPKLGSEGEPFNIGPITIDDQSRVWVGLVAGSIVKLYRATQTSLTNLEYCPYDIGDYKTNDLKYFDDAIWLGDYAHGRILRFDLDPVNNSGTLTAWQLDPLANPYGLVFDTDDSLWWVENSGQIGHLSFGTTDTLTYYPIPGASNPQWITIQHRKIWYSDGDGKIGQLDPLVASHQDPTQIAETPLGIRNVACEPLNPLLPTGGDFMETKSLTFSAFDPPLVPDTSNTGWTIYTLPAGAKPAGMATAGNAVFVADSDTSTKGIGKLIRFTLPQDQYQVYLPLILR